MPNTDERFPIEHWFDPLEQWFDMTKRITRENKEVAVADMWLYAYKEGEDLGDPDVIKELWRHERALNKAVAEHNKAFHRKKRRKSEASTSNDKSVPLEKYFDISKRITDEDLESVRNDIYSYADEDALAELDLDEIGEAMDRAVDEHNKRFPLQLSAIIDGDEVDLEVHSSSTTSGHTSLSYVKIFIRN